MVDKLCLSSQLRDNKHVNKTTNQTTSGLKCQKLSRSDVDTFNRNNQVLQKLEKTHKHVQTAWELVQEMWGGDSVGLSGYLWRSAAPHKTSGCFNMMLSLQKCLMTSTSEKLSNKKNGFQKTWHQPKSNKFQHIHHKSSKTNFWIIRGRCFRGNFSKDQTQEVQMKVGPLRFTRTWSPTWPISWCFMGKKRKKHNDKPEDSSYYFHATKT